MVAGGAGDFVVEPVLLPELGLGGFAGPDLPGVLLGVVPVAGLGVTEVPLLCDALRRTDSRKFSRPPVPSSLEITASIGQEATGLSLIVNTIS